MPTEPDNKMDDLLKTYAKKRREDAGAPMEMHPVTRRLLQVEAAKLKPTPLPMSTSWLDALKVFWPRVAFAAGILFIGGVMAVTFLQPPGQQAKTVRLAKQDTGATTDDRNSTLNRAGETQVARTTVPAKPAGDSAVPERKAESTAPVRRESRALSELATIPEQDMADAEKKLKADDVAQDEPRNNVVMSRAAGRPAATLPAAPAPAEREPRLLGGVAAPKAVDNGVLAGGRPALLPDIATTTTELSARGDSKEVDALESRLKEAESLAVQLADSKAVTDSFGRTALQPQQNVATARRRFANIANLQAVAQQTLGKSATAQPTTVLANFVIEQSGEQLRVVDGDGSVYEGKVLYPEVPGVAGYDAQLNLAADKRVDAAGSAVEQNFKDAHMRQQHNAQSIDGPATSAWNFRVSGTNRTLQQPVIVDGILYETAVSNSVTQAGAKAVDQNLQSYRFAPAQVPSQPRSYSLSASAVQNSAAPPAGQTSFGGQSLNLLNASRIQGQVRVGATNQLPLDAVRDANQP